MLISAAPPARFLVVVSVCSFCCIFLLIQLALHNNSRLQPFRNRQTKYTPASGLSKSQKYSIIISTYDRYKFLLQSLDHYGHADLPNLDAVFIAWGLGSVDPPESLNFTNYSVPVHLVRASANSLTERFRKPAEMRTEVGLWLDDDILIDPATVEYTFRVWKEYGQQDHRIVGFSGRLHERTRKGGSRYLFGRREYSMVLTNAAFLDTTMLEWFWELDKREVEAIKYVDEHMNCEDILMNYVVAKHTQRPPVLTVAQGHIQVLRSIGISSKKHHDQQRGKCVTKFTRLYGDILRKSDIAMRQPPVEAHAIVEADPRYQQAGESWGRGKTFVP